MGNSQYQIEKVGEWHKNIFNWEIEHPGASVEECAAHFNVTPGWMSTVRNSDCYIEYASICRFIHNDHVSKNVLEQVEGLANVSLEVLQERISRERNNIGLGIVNDSAALALKAMGFGQKNDARGGNTQINVILGGASKEVLERARDKMRTVNAHREPDSVGALPAPDPTPPIPVTIDEVADENQPPLPVSATS